MGRLLDVSLILLLIYPADSFLSVWTQHRHWHQNQMVWILKSKWRLIHYLTNWCNKKLWYWAYKVWSLNSRKIKQYLIQFVCHFRNYKCICKSSIGVSYIGTEILTTIWVFHLKVKLHFQLLKFVLLSVILNTFCFISCILNLLSMRGQQPNNSPPPKKAKRTHFFIMNFKYFLLLLLDSCPNEENPDIFCIQYICIIWSIYLVDRYCHGNLLHIYNWLYSIHPHICHHCDTQHLSMNFDLVVEGSHYCQHLVLQENFYYGDNLHCWSWILSYIQQNHASLSDQAAVMPH